MKIKQTIKTLVAGFFVLALVAVASPAASTFAAADTPGSKGCGVDTAIITCTDVVDVRQDGVENTAVWGLLLLAINILSAGVGIVAIGGVVYGSILYTSAGGSPEQVKKAMGIITNVVIGVVAYALMFSVLNFLIPGGLFN